MPLRLHARPPACRRAGRDERPRGGATLGFPTRPEAVLGANYQLILPSHTRVHPLCLHRMHATALHATACLPATPHPLHCPTLML